MVQVDYGVLLCRAGVTKMIVYDMQYIMPKIKDMSKEIWIVSFQLLSPSLFFYSMYLSH
jgi:hypothetical protein